MTFCHQSLPSPGSVLGLQSWTWLVALQERKIFLNRAATTSQFPNLQKGCVFFKKFSPFCWICSCRAVAPAVWTYRLSLGGKITAPDVFLASCLCWAYGSLTAQETVVAMKKSNAGSVLLWNIFQLSCARHFYWPSGKCLMDLIGQSGLWLSSLWICISLAGCDKVRSHYLDYRVDPCKKGIIIPVMKNSDS